MRLLIITLLFFSFCNSRSERNRDASNFSTSNDSGLGFTVFTNLDSSILILKKKEDIWTSCAYKFKEDYFVFINSTRDNRIAYLFYVSPFTIPEILDNEKFYKNGLFIKFDESGQYQTISNFRNDTLNGTTLQFDKEKDSILVITYESNNIINKKRIYRSAQS